MKRSLIIALAPFAFLPALPANAQTNICATNPAACAQQSAGAMPYGYQPGYGAGYGAGAYPAPPPLPGYGYGYGYGSPYGYYQPQATLPAATLEVYQQQQQAQQAAQQAAAQQQQQTMQQQTTLESVLSSALGPLPHPANPDFSRYSPSKWGEVGRPNEVAKLARMAGIQAGYAEEAARIADYLASPDLTQKLDADYPFGEVMLPNNVAPPVISEIRDAAQSRGDKILYLTLGTYEISKPARVAVRPPSWRDYLDLPIREPRALKTAEIVDSADQKAWDKGFEDGKAIGIGEARAMFSQNLNALVRDYHGMRRYFSLQEQGALSLPVVKTGHRGVRLADGRRRAYVDQKVVKLVVSPRFKAQRAEAYR